MSQRCLCSCQGPLTVARRRIAPAQQRIKLARPLQGGKIIIAAHMGRTDENLRHGHASIRARHHLASALRIAAHVDLRELDALARSEEHTSELQSLTNLVCRL